jgi:5-methylcytosine-specific restriction endonuclease McrA
MSQNLFLKLNTTIESGELFKLVDSSLSARQVLSKLGYSTKGQYVKIVRKYLEENNVDISHFTVNGQPFVLTIEKTCPCCFKFFYARTAEEKRKTTCSKACSNTYFRTQIPGGYKYRQKALDYYGAKCMSCGYDASIKALEVHHIDSNRKNNSIDNLNVLCANCHTITHKPGNFNNIIE